MTVSAVTGRTEATKEHPILRQSFEDVETMSGRKVVVFVSNKQDASAAKSSVGVLRSVRDKLVQDNAVNVPVSFIRVDCSEEANQDKCKVAKFSKFPRWFVHTEQGGIEDLWNPLGQTAESIVQYFKFRTSDEPITNSQVSQLQHFSSLLDLTSVRPVVLNFQMPWSGRSKRFQRHFEMVSSKLSSNFFFFKASCEEMRETCTSQRVESYPTVIVYFQDDQGKVHSADYFGRESFSALESFLSQKKSVADLLNEKSKEMVDFSNVGGAKATPGGNGNDDFETLLSSFETRFKKFMKVGFKTIVSKITKNVEKTIKSGKPQSGKQPKKRRKRKPKLDDL